MFHPDTSLDLPTGCALLAEIGVDRHTVREIAEDERAIRCPDRGAVYPEPRLREPLPGTGVAATRWHEPAAPWDPASSLPPAD